MRRWILTLGLVLLVAAGCNEGTTLPPEDDNTLTSVSTPQFQYLVDPGVAASLTRSASELAPRAAIAAAEGEGEAEACATVDFEGLSDMGAVGAAGVTFGTSWIALVDEDDGGSGPIANEPSASTVALVLDNDDVDIALDEPVSSVTVWYSAAASGLPLTLEGLDAGAAVVASAVGDQVGTDFDGADCAGDPTGPYCAWHQLEISTDEATIETLRFQSSPLVYAIDDLTLCTGDPDGPGDGGELEIDVKPGSDENTINPKAEGKIPVGVFGSEDLDVTELDWESFTLGDGEPDEAGVALDGGGRPMAQVLDLNGDEFPDLLLHFDVGELVENGDLDWDTESLTLQGSMVQDEGAEEGEGGEAGAADEGDGGGEGAGEEGEDEAAAADVLSGTDMVQVVGADNTDEGGDEAETSDAEDSDDDPRNRGQGNKYGHEKN